MRETSRSSGADEVDDGNSANLGAASGRAISLLPFTEDAAATAENLIGDTTAGNVILGAAAAAADEFSRLRLEVNGNTLEAAAAEEGSGIARGSASDDTSDQRQPQFATQQFEDFVDFSSF